MERIGVRELRQHASRYLALVKQGQRVEVTDRGRLVALLVPPDEGMAAREALVAAGRLRPASAAFTAPVRAIGAERSEDVLAALRDDG